MRILFGNKNTKKEDALESELSLLKKTYNDLFDEYQKLQDESIPLTRAEIQSGHDRQKWAEGLILQLPENHDGRNSWLINYGVSEEATAKKKKWNESKKRYY